LLLLTSLKAFLVALIFEKGIFLREISSWFLKTLLMKLKATNSFSLFNFEYFYKKKVSKSD
jgi:hypothetical protein